MKILAWPAYSNPQINPYTFLLYKWIAKRADVQVYEFKNKDAITKKFDILHVHWPEAMLIRLKNPVLAHIYILKFYISVKILKLKGAKLVWTIHNIKSHEDNFIHLRSAYFKWFIDAVDGVLFLSEATLEAIKRPYPELLEKPFAVTPHGHYKDIYPNTISQQEAREKLQLGIDDIVFLFVGQIRQYKNITSLISTFHDIDNPKFKLVIAGSPDSSELRDSIQEASAIDPRITTYLQFISTEDMQTFLNAADMLILPYEEILNSGTAILGLSFNKPVILPNKGAMAELKKIVGSEWVYTYEGSFNSTILLNSVLWLNEYSRSKEPPLHELSWETIASKTHKFYEHILDS